MVFFIEGFPYTDNHLCPYKSNAIQYHKSKLKGVSVAERGCKVLWDWVEWSGVAAAMRALVTPLIHSTQLQSRGQKVVKIVTSQPAVRICTFVNLSFELSGFCYSIGSNSRTLEMKCEMFETETETIYQPSGQVDQCCCTHYTQPYPWPQPSFSIQMDLR